MVVCIRRVLPLVVSLWAFTGLSACTTVNMTGGETLSNLSRTQKELRTQASELSDKVWDSVSDASFFGYLAGMLVNGKEDEAEGPGLVADSGAPGYTIAAAYVEQKAQQYTNLDAQIEAMTTDLRKKTSDAEAFVKATEAVLNSHRQGTTRVATLDSSALVRGIAEWRDDRKVIETSIADARQQKATFETAQLALRHKYPLVDTTGLDQELNSFAVQINRMMALSDAMASFGAEA